MTEEGIIFCWGKVEGCWSRQGTGKELLKIPKGDCRRCNLIKDCDSGLDEDNCPAYVAPSFELPIYCTLVVLLLGILFLRRTYGTLEKTGIPVMPPSLFLGSEPFLKHKITYVEQDRENRRKYGRVWAGYEMCEPWVTVADPGLIKAITVKNFDNFSAHWGVGTMESKFVTLDQAVGQEWKDLRRGLTPTFTSGKIKGMLALIGSSVDNMVEHLEEVVAQDNPVVDVKNIFQCMALDVIAKCAFGIESNSFKNPNNKVFVNGKKLIEEFSVDSVLASVMMNLFQVHEKIGNLIDMVPASMDDLWKITKSVQLQRQSAGPGPGDFIDILNDLNRKVEKGEFPAVTSEQITGQVRRRHLFSFLNSKLSKLSPGNYFPRCRV